MKIAILGGGVAGLTAAFRLQDEHEPIVFEASDRAGGNLRSERFGDCLLEWGPNGVLDNAPATSKLIRDLGLESRVCRARDSAARRFVLRGGKLRLLPRKPSQLLLNGMLPLGARLRLLREPRVRKPAPEGDESIHAFVTRRFGPQAADVLADAFVTGVFAGDIHRLSLRSCFPRIAGLESEHGSVFRGLRAKGGPKGTLLSFDGGMQILVDALAERVDVRLAARAEQVNLQSFDHVVCALPASRAAHFFAGTAPALADELAAFPFAPIAVVGLHLRGASSIPEGFGFLVPRNEGLRLLGTLCESTIFPGRAPEGEHLFRVMIGGRHDPEAVSLPDDELVPLVLRELRAVWGPIPDPAATKVVRHRLGIPQYELGHADRLERIDALLPENTTLLGNSYRGVSVNACIQEASAWRPA